MAERTPIYHIYENYRNVKRMDLSVAVGQADADMERGNWVQKDSSGKAVKAESGVTQAGGASVIGKAIFPITTGKESPDSLGITNNVTVARQGQHVVRTDRYQTPSDGRTAWAVNVPFVVLNGLPCPYIAARDTEESIRGHVDSYDATNSILNLYVY